MERALQACKASALGRLGRYGTLSALIEPHYRAIELGYLDASEPGNSSTRLLVEGRIFF
ncbi:hypothetical protein [Rivularia sp. UHCC 0363]|uniref:hypothetical protein n=1 Tax=Rivularia sp. UHCC 0363 TaxID=3110244 RepID=UPI002B205DF1|nr:hypothetical protein [Rivularia sp. UHCC 0363]MEA5596992.1 hypothetical protein [Rivularia sp. UHCC 0363]